MYSIGGEQCITLINCVHVQISRGDLANRTSSRVILVRLLVNHARAAAKEVLSDGRCLCTVDPPTHLLPPCCAGREGRAAAINLCVLPGSDNNRHARMHLHTTDFAKKLSSRNKMNFCSLLLAVVALAQVASASSNLPVIFFHGVFSTYKAGDNFVANLTAANRTVVSLSFCDGSCSTEAILTQIPKAVATVREVVANDSVFDDGYIFIAHSQGGPIARAVIEEMDDHKVKRFISLAGLQNGQFIGPDKVEVSIANNNVFFNMLVPQTLFNYSKYAPEDYYGKMQKDFVLYSVENPDAQYTVSQFNVNRWPQFGSFSTANFFLPVYNNVNRCLLGNDQCIYDQQRRKANFLKLEQAHFFASPADDVIMPWQSCIFGRYSEVDTIEEIETKYMNMTVVNMNETLEYTADTFGLQTLEKRGGLFLHPIENVSHSCWAADEDDCVWADVYDQHIYPTLV
jgi:palmitoyl-protein thioesterase